MAKIDQQAKVRLEGVLDAQFPKVEKEGKAKIAMRRGPALVLFAEAVSIFTELVKAFGGCEKCWGKGYSTQGTGQGTIYNTCTCDRGKQIDDMIVVIGKRAAGN